MTRALVPALVAVLVAAGAAQSANPRVGRWKLRQDAPPPASNIMIYEAVPGGGLKVTVDSVGRDGQKGGWTYTTRLDGKDVPIIGHRTANGAAARVIDARMTEIIYKKDGTPTQFLTNVISEDGRTLTVTFKNPEGKITAVAVYEKM